MHNTKSRIVMVGVLLVGVSIHAPVAVATLIGKELDLVGISIRTESFSPSSVVDSLALYESIPILFGTETILTPVNVDIAPAVFKSTEDTFGGVRTIRMAIETTGGGVFAAESVFDTLIPSDLNFIQFFSRNSVGGVFKDNDLIGEISNTVRFLGTNGEILFENSNMFPFFVSGISVGRNDGANPFGEFFWFGKGMPSSVEIVYVYNVIPAPAVAELLLISSVGAWRRRTI